MINKCILCDIDGEDFGTKPDYNAYSTKDPSGVSSGVRRTYSFLKCPQCDLWWVKDPDENYYEHYNNEYWYEYQQKTWERPTIEERLIHDLEFSNKRVNELFKYFNKPISILEIGCSSGALLKTLKQIGHNVEGIEMNERICNYAKNFVECPIYNHINTCTKTGYDMIIALDVLEHLIDPLENIKIWVDKCKPGGIIYLELPDAGCDHALNQGINWDYCTPIEHIYYYTMRHVETIMYKFNCDLLECYNVWTTDRQRLIFRKSYEN